MKILVVGGGGREHAIIKKLKENPRIATLYCAPGNGGIGRDAVCVPIKSTDIPAMTDWAVENKMDYVVVAQDDPLVLGMVDAMNARGIPCFGPDKAAARIEGSKVFSKALMKRYNIPTAAYESFDDPTNAKDYVRSGIAYPVWIKTNGLALGKGAIMAEGPDQAADILHSIMEEKAFGESGSEVVIEEHMEGVEVTVLAFTDGKSISPMVSSMDHKRAGDGDTGLNTGGMGTIAPNPHYSPDITTICMNQIFLPTIRAMEQEGCPFKGTIYFGLMLTPTGPKVVEYNCRFGDPEAQVVLPLLESDLLEIMLACTNGTLDRLDIRWRTGAAACVIMASGGYPVNYETGLPISGLNEDGGINGAIVYHAGTKLHEGAYLTAGGRVLGVTALGADLKNALCGAYAAVEKISFPNAHYRRDIGLN